MRRSELIKGMRPLLRQRRKALLAALNDDRLMSHADNDVRDIADEATETEYRNVTAELTELESRELEQVESALQRINEGKYGVCDGCSKNIPMARLQALPYATMCIKCQQEADRMAPGYMRSGRLNGPGTSLNARDGAAMISPTDVPELML